MNCPMCDHDSEILDVENLSDLISIVKFACVNGDDGCKMVDWSIIDE